MRIAHASISHLIVCKTRATEMHIPRVLIAIFSPFLYLYLNIAFAINIPPEYSIYNSSSLQSLFPARPAASLASTASIANITSAIEASNALGRPKCRTLWGVHLNKPSCFAAWGFIPIDDHLRTYGWRKEGRQFDVSLPRRFLSRTS